MGKEYKHEAPGITPAREDALRQTVWQHDDEAIQRFGDHPPETHWSRQNTQPLGPRWPALARRRMAAQRGANGVGRQSRALGMGAGLGSLLTLLALSLVLLLAIANGWLLGGLPPAPDSTQPWPIPIQSTPQVTAPAGTSNPSSTTLPSVTAEPTTTATPATPTATPQPTATPTSEPTATPQPTATP